MTEFSFAPASREQARARIGLQGPAGSGKTKTALLLAEGLAQGGPIGLIDTERRSALTYAVVPGQPHLGGHEFGHMPMDSYDPRNLIQAVRAAEQARLAVLIVDSWSHFWNGRGGLLEIVDQTGSGALGSFGGWKKGNPIEQDMLDALLNFSGHLIVTLRTKTDYLVDDSGSKKTITKVGTKVVQRDTYDYELGLLVDMVEGTGTVIKTRYEPLDGLSIHHPGQELGQQILEQLGQGVDPVEGLLKELKAADLTYAGALDLHARAKARGLLRTEAAHPHTGEVMTLGKAIAAVGSALKPAPMADPSPAQQAPDEYAEQAASQDDASGREAGGAEHAEPAADSTVPPEPDPSSAIPARQMRKIFALFKANGGPEDRAKRLHAMSLLLGKPVGSMNELAVSDGNELLDILTGFEGQGPDALRNLLNKLAAPAA